MADGHDGTDGARQATRGIEAGAKGCAGISIQRQLMDTHVPRRRIAGVCPGPAIASLASAAPSVVTFVGAMTTGLLFVDALRRMRRALPARTAGARV